MPGRASSAERRREASEKLEAAGYDPGILDDFDRKKINRFLYELVRRGGGVKFALKAISESQETAEYAARRFVIDEKACASIREDLSDLEKQRKNLIRRQVQIARFGSDEYATRAFMALARVAGWNAATKFEVSGKVLTLHGILSDPALVSDFLNRTSHEPGPPTKVDWGADEPKALAGGHG